MSGSSYETKCPNCRKSADGYVDWKPFDTNSITCCHCGLRIYTTHDYMDLEELNQQRKEYNMRALKKLPKQSDDIW